MATERNETHPVTPAMQENKRPFLKANTVSSVRQSAELWIRASRASGTTGKGLRWSVRSEQRMTRRHPDRSGGDRGHSGRVSNAGRLLRWPGAALDDVCSPEGATSGRRTSRGDGALPMSSSGRRAGGVRGGRGWLSIRGGGGGVEDAAARGRRMVGECGRGRVRRSLAWADGCAVK